MPRTIKNRIWDKAWELAENVLGQSPPDYLAFLLWFLSEILKRKPRELLHSLFGCRVLKDAKNPPHMFSRPPVESPHLEFQKPFFSLLSLKCFLYQLPSSAFAPPHSSSLWDLEFLTISLETPTYSTPLPVTRWVVAPHKSTIAYLPRIHMDSRRVAINPKKPI